MKNNLEDIVINSGNVFHYQVVEFLRENGWTVLISPFYNDNLTDKPREIDIIAEKEFDVYSHGHSWEGTLNVRLFIECKYINQNTIFWFDKKDYFSAIRRIMADTGLKHPDENINITEHRFYKLNKVAKLFASGKENQEKEFIYKAINQSLNAMLHSSSRPSIIPSERKGKIKKILKTINYPVILCSSFADFYQINVDDPDKKITPIVGNFNLEINYAYLDFEKNPKAGYFLIDIVSFENLSNFLAELEKTDISIIKNDIIWSLRVRK
ncbi:MAG: hypothetical protein WC441_01920 [Patescibacteria group bacterium]